MELTIVTSYFQIKSKHSFGAYEGWMNNMLRIQTPMVIFTDSVSRVVVERQIGLVDRPANLTHIVETEIVCLESFQQFGRQFEQHYEMEPWKHQYNNPMIYVLYAEKSVFVRQAIAANLWNSRMFFWVDIGCFRYQRELKRYLERPWPSVQRVQSLLADTPSKVLITAVTSGWFSPAAFKAATTGLGPDFTGKYTVCGAIFGGFAPAMLDWHYKYWKTLQEYFREGRFAGMDQNLMATLCLKYNLCWLIRPPARLQQKVGKTNKGWFYAQPFLAGSAVAPQPERVRAADVAKASDTVIAGDTASGLTQARLQQLNATFGAHAECLVSACPPVVRQALLRVYNPLLLTPRFLADLTEFAVALAAQDPFPRADPMDREDCLQSTPECSLHMIPFLTQLAAADVWHKAAHWCCMYHLQVKRVLASLATLYPLHEARAQAGALIAYHRHSGFLSGWDNDIDVAIPNVTRLRLAVEASTPQTGLAFLTLMHTHGVGASAWLTYNNSSAPWQFPDKAPPKRHRKQGRYRLLPDAEHIAASGPGFVHVMPWKRDASGVDQDCQLYGIAQRCGDLKATEKQYPLFMGLYIVECSGQCSVASLFQEDLMVSNQTFLCSQHRG